MSSSVIAGMVALALVVSFLVGLGVLSLFSGVFHTFLDRPKLKILKSQKYNFGFAFSFQWNGAKDPANIDTVQVRLYNPEGNPTQVEISRTFQKRKSSFAMEVDMGEKWVHLLGVQGFTQARVSIQVSASKEGLNFEFEMSGEEFRKNINIAKFTAEQIDAKWNPPKSDDSHAIVPEVPERSFIVDKLDVVPMQLAIANNPVFSAYFANVGGGGDKAGGGAGAAAAVNFKVAKVWIEPGCIVCNACEDTYPEVFEVLADTCIVRPNYPLDDGLKVQEAAEGCPVEVIKFAKA
ncbi:MAG: ferredoxin [Bacteriovoracaceae bacterium]|nr:ferredoxin [Bacteriovoracaceae bacterium]